MKSIETLLMEDELIKLETAEFAIVKGIELDSFVILQKPLTQTLLQRWLREVHGIQVQPFYHPNTISTREIKAELEIIRLFAKEGISKSCLPPSLKGVEYDTYEEAFEVGLQAALKLINIK